MGIHLCLIRLDIHGDGTKAVQSGLSDHWLLHVVTEQGLVFTVVCHAHYEDIYVYVPYIGTLEVTFGSTYTRYLQDW